MARSGFQPLVNVRRVAGASRPTPVSPTPTPTPGQAYTLYSGVSDDNTPEASELTTAGVDRVLSWSAYAGSKYMIFGRKASEPLITAIYFSDAPSQNQIGAFGLSAQRLIPPGETELFHVWVSNQSLTQPVDVTARVV